jgi:hypothetical protein
VSNEVPSLATSTLKTAYEPKAPFPERLKEPSHFGKQGEKIQDMMEVFKQVKTNIPLLDAIRQIPSYAKKCIIRNHIPKKIILTEQVISLIRHNFPQKFRDPGAPTISCIIEYHQIEKALLDLGAGMTLVPYSVYLQLDLGELKPTTAILQLANRSVKKSRGVIEDVIISIRVC